MHDFTFRHFLIPHLWHTASFLATLNLVEKTDNLHAHFWYLSIFSLRMFSDFSPWLRAVSEEKPPRVGYVGIYFFAPFSIGDILGDYWVIKKKDIHIRSNCKQAQGIRLPTQSHSYWRACCWVLQTCSALSFKPLARAAELCDAVPKGACSIKKCWKLKNSLFIFEKNWRFFSQKCIFQTRNLACFPLNGIKNK